MRLRNKTALITGAAQGQGEAVAKRFSKEIPDAMIERTAKIDDAMQHPTIIILLS